MRRTCFEMLKEIGIEIGLVNDITITSFTNTSLRSQLLMYLNRAKSWVGRNVALTSVMDTTTFGTTTVYNTGTVSITQNTTSIVGVGTTFTTGMVGRSLTFGTSKTPYKVVEFTDTTHIELDRPLIEDDISGGTYQIYVDTYTLPPFITDIHSIRPVDRVETLQRKSQAWLNTRYTLPTQITGIPRFWALTGTKETREPEVLNYAADATTSTTAIVDAALANTTVQDGYKDWTVYNVTRVSRANVLSYDISTTTLNLDRTITDQTTADAYFLTKMELQVALRPTPLSAKAFVITYFKDLTLFQNDTDFETEINKSCEEILIYRSIAEYYISKDQTKAAGFITLANNVLQNLKELNESSHVQRLVFGGGDRYYGDSASLGSGYVHREDGGY